MLRRRSDRRDGAPAVGREIGPPSLARASDQPASHVKFTYRWKRYNGSEKSEEFETPLVATLEGESQLLRHAPNITSPTCKGATSFDLTIDMTADLMPGSHLTISALDADFTSSVADVRWEKCPYGIDD